MVQQYFFLIFFLHIILINQHLITKNTQQNKQKILGTQTYVLAEIIDFKALTIRLKSPTIKLPIYCQIMLSQANYKPPIVKKTKLLCKTKSWTSSISQSPSMLVMCSLKQYYHQIFKFSYFLLINYNQLLKEVMKQNQLKLVQTQIFGKYILNVRCPFKIIQAPFRKCVKYQRDGHWNEKERLKYCVFLTFFQDILQDPNKKKNVRIYQMMSDMIVTRNSNQCRSHHQKMEKYRISIPQIINSMMQKYEPRVYKELEQKYMVLIKTLLDNLDKYIRCHAYQKQDKVKIMQRRGNQNKSEDLPFSQNISFKQDNPYQLLNNQNNKEKALLENELNDDKKQIKKTTDQYSCELQDIRNQEQEDIPRLILSELKQQQDHISNYQINDGYNIFNEEVPKQTSIPLQELLPQLEHNLMFTNQSKRYYDQQIKAFQLKKQWHVHNADQLYTQWNNQIQSIKYCDETIKLFRMAFLPGINNIAALDI